MTVVEVNMNSFTKPDCRTWQMTLPSSPDTGPPPTRISTIPVARSVVKLDMMVWKVLLDSNRNQAEIVPTVDRYVLSPLPLTQSDPSKYTAFESRRESGDSGGGEGGGDGGGNGGGSGGGWGGGGGGG